jgi:L,D-transpeptidase catalytic domain
MPGYFSCAADLLGARRPRNPSSARWVSRLLYLTLGLTAALQLASARADSVPFWGAKASVAIDTPIDELKQGQFMWMGQAFSSGPVVMVVSLTEQRAYVYRNGILIGATTVSTGRPGHITPTGVFTVLQKQKEHRSTIYDGAPMPYMERLTWGGIALHAGGLPGYPESHGCVHLPSEFAKLLFDISPAGMTVVIASDATEPESVSHPGYLAPVNFVGGTPIERVPLGSEDERWQPELSPSGPVSIVLSQASHRIVVYRNGIEIGRARLTVVGNEPLAAHVLILADGPSSIPDPFVPDSSKFRWSRIGVPGHLGEAGTNVDPAAIERIRIPAEFVSRVNSVLTTGATVFVTDEALSAESSGAPVQVVDANPPPKPLKKKDT